MFGHVTCESQWGVPLVDVRGAAILDVVYAFVEYCISLLLFNYLHINITHTKKIEIVRLQKTWNLPIKLYGLI